VVQTFATEQAGCPVQLHHCEAETSIRSDSYLDVRAKQLNAEFHVRGCGGPEIAE
jgi:hypothetical protein